MNVVHNYTEKVKMLKHMFTLVRGAAHDHGEAVSDAHALSILRQQIRDASQAVQTSWHTVAVAMAQQAQHKKQHERLESDIADLEARALAALENGRDDLAREAADCIASLEDERNGSQTVLARCDGEILRLKSRLKSAETRLIKLKQGHKIAAATDRVQKLGDAQPSAQISSLNDAENTLAKLKHRQDRQDLTEEALCELEATHNPDRVRKALADAGCGTPEQTSADDVLNRLKSKSAKSTPKTSN